jgi:VWFA-related protein
MQPLLPTGAFILGLSAMMLLPGQTQHPTISVETDLVLLRVTVVDSHGARVGGLNEQNFAVYDNGAPARITFFSNEDSAVTVGLLIDSSSSMAPVRSAVTAAGTAFAASRDPLDEIFTLNFNDVVRLGLPLSVASPATIERLHQQLELAPAQGMTALYDAVDKGIAQLNTGTRDRKVLIVVSDGDDNASEQTRKAVVAKARASGAVIYSVALINRDDPTARYDVLKQLARDSGGEVFRPERMEDIATVFKEIAVAIRSGYTIAIMPPEHAAAGFRTIRVTATSDDGRPLTARTRAGYEIMSVAARPR